jgi:hypothetical protein
MRQSFRGNAAGMPGSRAVRRRNVPRPSGPDRSAADAGVFTPRARCINMAGDAQLPHRSHYSPFVDSRRTGSGQCRTGAPVRTGIMSSSGIAGSGLAFSGEDETLTAGERIQREFAECAAARQGVRQ